MIRNEKGFALPFTLIVATIMIFFFLNQVNVYMLEKRYYKEIEGIMTLDHFMEMTIYHIKKDIREGITGDREFMIKFAEGLAEVKIAAEETTTENLNMEHEINETNQEPHIFQIDILCTIKSNQRYRATFTYDSDLDSISNWIE